MNKYVFLKRVCFCADISVMTVRWWIGDNMQYFFLGSEILMIYDLYVNPQIMQQ